LCNACRNKVELFSFVKSKTTTLAAGKDCPDLSFLFHLPLSNQAFAQMEQINSDFQQLTLTRHLELHQPIK
jgi:hypothetical protein